MLEFSSFVTIHYCRNHSTRRPQTGVARHSGSDAQGVSSDGPRRTGGEFEKKNIYIVFV